MNLLAFDTSTEALSVALQCGDKRYRAHRLEPRQQAAQLLPTIDTLAAEAEMALRDVSIVVYGRGPGSFTGVRIAVAAAQGLSLSLGAQTVGVSTLAALAQSAREACGAERVTAALDARMGEIYLGDYRYDARTQCMVSTGLDRVCAPSELAACDPDAVFVGTGAEVYSDTVPGRLEPGLLPTATALLALAAPVVAAGQLEAPGCAEPVYLRDKVAYTEAERR